jgi:signal transduction histidine kinase
MWAYILPEQAERDEGFRQRVLKLSHQGLYVIGVVEISVPALMLLAQFLMGANRSTWALRSWQAASVVAVGLLTLLMARLKPSRLPARAIGWLSGLLVGAILISFSLLLAGAGEMGDHYIPGQMTTVLLVGVAALPLRPVQTLSLGLSLWAYYLIAGLVAVRWNIVGAVDPDGTQSVFIVMVTLLSSALTALLYAERRSNYIAHQEALRASETVCRAQSRVLLSENAASLGRLAAALSHELNNPIGALRSSVDSLLLLAGRQAASPPEDQKHLVLLQADLRRSVGDSAQRLQQIVARLQRFTNLDKADIQPADINAIVGDVVALVEPEMKNGVKLELDLQPLASLMCRPQQLSAVFSNLLHNAIEAVENGNGRVWILTLEKDSQVEVQIRDNGRGLRPSELSTIFDPGFKIAGGRVSTGNWSLFSSRQIIREHSGEIYIESVEGKGTTVRVTLPRLRESDLERGSGVR